MSDFITIARTEDIPEGEARIIDIDGRSIALCHVTGQGFYAVDNVCTHDDGPLGEGTLRDDRIECPRHGALFDVKTGAAKTLPAVRAVCAHDLRVVDGAIQIAIKK